MVFDAGVFDSGVFYTGGGGFVPGETVVTTVIKVDGVEITENVDIRKSTWQMNAGVNPGTARVYVLDQAHTAEFAIGTEVTLDINGLRVWGGYLMGIRRSYAFDVDETSTPTETPRYLILECSDYNLLFQKRFIYNKAAPEEPMPIYQAGVTDKSVVLDIVNNYTDFSGDGIQTAGVLHVGTPVEDMATDIGEPPDNFGSAMRYIAQMPGAIFYFDTYKNLNYADVDIPNAPFALSDEPNNTTSFGYGRLELLEDGTSLGNDAMVWGAAIGINKMAFQRYEDDDSIDEHGRWQWADFRKDLYKSASVLKRATTYVDGSVQNNRGHKDDAISIRCRTRQPGLRAGMKVNFTNGVHGYSDVIPIRSMRITFANPNEAIYDLYLAHYIDEAWNTAEFGRDGPPPEEPVTVCEEVEGTPGDGDPYLITTHAFGNREHAYVVDNLFGQAAIDNGGPQFRAETDVSGNWAYLGGGSATEAIRRLMISHVAPVGAQYAVLKTRIVGHYNMAGPFTNPDHDALDINWNVRQGTWGESLPNFDDYGSVLESGATAFDPLGEDAGATVGFYPDEDSLVDSEITIPVVDGRLQFVVEVDPAQTTFTGSNTGAPGPGPIYTAADVSRYTSTTSTYSYFPRAFITVHGTPGGSFTGSQRDYLLEFWGTGVEYTTSLPPLNNLIAYNADGNEVPVTISGQVITPTVCGLNSDEFDRTEISSWGNDWLLYGDYREDPAAGGTVAVSGNVALSVATLTGGPWVAGSGGIGGAWDANAHLDLDNISPFGTIIHYRFQVDELTEDIGGGFFGGYTNGVGIFLSNGDGYDGGTDYQRFYIQKILTGPSAGKMAVSLQCRRSTSTFESAGGPLIYVQDEALTTVDFNINTWYEVKIELVPAQQNPAYMALRWKIWNPALSGEPTDWYEYDGFGGVIGSVALTTFEFKMQTYGTERTAQFEFFNMYTICADEQMPQIICYETYDPGTVTIPFPEGDVYRPNHLRQLGWGTSLDGDNCNMTAAAVALDRHTEGVKTSTPPLMRSFQSDQVGGTDLNDAADAWSAGYSETLTVSVLSWTSFKSQINAGRGAIVQGDYQYIPDTYSGQPSFDGGHSIYVNEFNSDSSKALVYDPLRSTPYWLPASILQTYANAFAGGSNVSAGFTQITG
jgi:hypothetical protein